MSQEFGWGYYLREVFRSRSGAVGIVMLSILLSAAVYVTLTTPPSVFQSWFNPANWVNNPINVPPTWINYFNGVRTPQAFRSPLPLRRSTPPQPFTSTPEWPISLIHTPLTPLTSPFTYPSAVRSPQLTSSGQARRELRQLLSFPAYRPLLL